MTDYVLNEWVWADLVDDANRKNRDEAFNLFV